MCGLGLKQKLTEMGSFLPNQQAYAINSVAQTLKVAEPYDPNLRSFDMNCKENADILHSFLILEQSSCMPVVEMIMTSKYYLHTGKS